LPEKKVKITVKVLVPVALLLSLMTGERGDACAWELPGSAKADVRQIQAEERTDCKDNVSVISREDIRKEYEKEIVSAKEKDAASLELEKEVAAALERNNALAEKEIEREIICNGIVDVKESGFFRMETEEYSRKIYGKERVLEAVLLGGKKEEKEIREKDSSLREKRECELPGFCFENMAEVDIYEQYMYIRGVTGGRGIEGKYIV